MRHAQCFGFLATVTLVIGCSSAGPTAPDRENVGDQSPAVVADPGAGKKPAESTPAAPSGDGSPVPYPNAPAGAATQAPAAPVVVPPVVKSKMTFFVTSTGTAALGGNLGGLTGADKKCQDLATAAAAGDHTWHAYLSATGINAKDRIGTGPWTNQKGAVIAQNLTALHDYQFIPPNASILDEKGAPVPLTATAILTGTKTDGTALPATCQDWTSATAQQNGHVGDAASETSVVLGSRWNDAVKSYGCSQQQIAANKGEGRIYCFAID
jgi:hypothetical protein